MFIYVYLIRLLAIVETDALNCERYILDTMFDPASAVIYK